MSFEHKGSEVGSEPALTVTHHSVMGHLFHFIITDPPLKVLGIFGGGQW